MRGIDALARFARRACAVGLGCLLGVAVPAVAGPVGDTATASQAVSRPDSGLAAQGPHVRLVAVRRVTLHGHQATLDLVLRVENPSAWQVALNDIRFRCSFNGTATATGHSTGVLDLPAHGAADVPVRVDIDSNALLAVLASLPPDGVVHYRLDGSAEISSTMLRIPFHDQGSVMLRLP